MCTMEARPPVFNFKIIDKRNGKDLFFGSNPTYSVNQLLLLQTYNNYIDTVRCRLDTLNHIVRFAGFAGNNTLVLKIKDISVDTIKVEKINRISNAPCSGTYVSAVAVNGQFVNADKNQNIIIGK